MNLRRNTIILVVAFAIITAGSVIFGILPFREDITAATSDIQEKRIRLATVKKEQENFVVLSRDFNNVSSEIRELDSLILKSNDSLAFISQLEKYADDSSVDLDLDLAELKASREVQSVPILIVIRGSFHSVLAFIEKLDTSPYYVLLTSLRMSQVSDNQVEATLQGTTYWIEDAL